MFPRREDRPNVVFYPRLYRLFSCNRNRRQFRCRGQNIVFRQAEILAIFQNFLGEFLTESLPPGRWTVFPLQKAIGQIENSFGLRSIFFVEDTSVRIEALSTDSAEYPGLRVKEWFKQVSFQELGIKETL